MFSFSHRDFIKGQIKAFLPDYRQRFAGSWWPGSWWRVAGSKQPRSGLRPRSRHWTWCWTWHGTQPGLRPRSLDRTQPSLWPRSWCWTWHWTWRWTRPGLRPGTGFGRASDSPAGPPTEGGPPVLRLKEDLQSSDWRRTSSPPTKGHWQVLTRPPTESHWQVSTGPPTESHWQVSTRDSKGEHQTSESLDATESIAF